VKIAITADLHMQPKNLQNIKAGWEELIDHLMNNKINCLLIAGDLFSNYNIGGREASMGTVYSALAEPIRRYRLSGGYIYAIPGNHDIAGQNQRDALVSLEELITVVREPQGMVIGENVHVQFLPWIYNNTATHDLLIPKAKKGYFDILLGHCEVSGTQVNNHYTIPIGGHFELPEEAFTGKGYDYIALGHIHKRVGRYIGAPWQLTFGEEGNPPGFVVLDTKNATESWVDITSTPQYHTYTADNIKRLPPKTTDYVKIKYAGEPPRIELGVNVTLEKIPEQGTMRARTDISTRSTLKEMLAAWMKDNIAPGQAGEPSLEELLHAASSVSSATGITSSIGSIERIESVRLCNIGTHIDTHIVLNGHNYIAISGQNGSGKTFLIDSICATLFGTFPSRKGSIFEHITHGYEGTASMEIVFSSRGKRYAAARKINAKRKHEAFLMDLATNKMIAGPKVSDFGREIGVLVGSEDIVLASIFSAQKGVGDIVDADPSMRKEILGQILDTNFLATIAESARQKVVSLKADVDAQQRRIAELAAKNQGRNIESDKQQLWNIDAELSSMGRSIVTLAGDIKRITEEGQELNRALAKTEEARKSLAEVKADISSIEENIVSLQRQIKNTILTIDAEASVVKKLKGIGAARKEYEELMKSREEGLLLESRLATIDGNVNVEKAKILHEEERIKGDIQTLTREIKAEYDECSRLVRSYMATLEIHLGKQKSLDSAGCKQEPLPCPFINDAIASAEEAEKVKALIEQTKKDSLLRHTHKEQQIAEYRKTLESEEYAKDAKTRIAKLQKERCKIAPVNINMERLVFLKKLVESEGKVLSELQRIESAKETLSDLEKRHIGEQEKRSSKKAKGDALASEVGKSEKTLARYNELKSLWESTSKLRDDTQGKIAETYSLKATLTERIRLYEEDLAEWSILDQRHTADIRTLRIYENVAMAFGRNGIPQLLIDSALPQIQDILNNLTAQLDNRFAIRFSTQQETQGGKIREALDIIASDIWGERDVANFSGGEQKLLKSVIRIAIAVFQAQRSGGKYEVLIIDEVFDALDRDNGIKVLQILASLQAQFKQIIVVSHTDDLLLEFPVRINFERTHKGSMFSINN